MGVLRASRTQHVHHHSLNGPGPTAPAISRPREKSISSTSSALRLPPQRTHHCQMRPPESVPVSFRVRLADLNLATRCSSKRLRARHASSFLVESLTNPIQAEGRRDNPRRRFTARCIPKPPNPPPTRRVLPGRLCVCVPPPCPAKEEPRWVVRGHGMPNIELRRNSPVQSNPLTSHYVQTDMGSVQAKALPSQP